MDRIYKGNAQLDGKLTRQWIIGNFMPEGDIRKTADIEIKWGVHPKGERRPEWTTEELGSAVSILISGQFVIEFSNKSVELSNQGDYVVWGPGSVHRWHATEDSVTLTVRWPSAA